MTVYCDYCGHKAALVDDSEIYGRSFGHTAYLCRNCGAYVGCHGRTDKPLGRLADATLRKWKMAAHASFDPLWKTGPFRGRRKAAYGWLAGQMGQDSLKIAVASSQELYVVHYISIQFKLQSCRADSLRCYFIFHSCYLTSFFLLSIDCAL